LNRRHAVRYLQRMLVELRIRNFAVIESLDLELYGGLTVLTGETGAGKSIIVDALALLLGERASAESVRPGAARARVEAVFDITDDPVIPTILVEQGIETADGLLILRREVAAEGRNRAWVNGSASTATLVGELGSRLIDLHGQHEHQTLLRPAEQRAILDAYANARAQAENVAATHERLVTIRHRLADLDARSRQIAQRADFLRFQVDEIDKAALREGEEQELEAEARRLDHAQELAHHARHAHDTLYGDEDAITSRLAELRRAIDQLARIDAELADAPATLENAYYSLEELGRRMGEYAAGIEHDPARLDALRRRQDLIFRLKTKYGTTIRDVLDVAGAARVELESLESADSDRQTLLREEAAAADLLRRQAEELSAARGKAARQLTRDMNEVLPGLGMQGGRMEVRLTRLDSPGASGSESVEFLIAVNAGFEPRPLGRVASGGELSRVMLALKSILARVDRVPTLIFDEIDAGIGGRVAHSIGATLKRVAETHQVFAITHLPQIASRGHHHLLVEKRGGPRATTHVTTLEGDDRVRELARLLGGDPESARSVEHARELLSGAR
jgi:DNA repair protein RecN (Recombination protein N)